MNRPTLLVASRHAAVATALRQYVDLLFPNGELSHRTEHIGFSSSAELFEKLDGCPPQQLRETMVLFDLGPEEGGSWEVSNMWSERGLAAQLLMSYPEVYFVFLRKEESADTLPFGLGAADKKIIRLHHFATADRLHELVELIQHHARGFRTIFDATGLRSLVKHQLLEKVGTEVSKIYQPLSKSRQEHAAAAADEEGAFVYLNGYVAYQAGFCTWLLNTRAEFNRLLCRQKSQDGGDDGAGRRAPKCISRVAGPQTFNVILSDWDLAFPDLQGSDTDQPLLLTPGLFDDSERLILITSFSDQTQQTLLTKQKGFRESKPYGGIFKLLTARPPQGENPLATRYEEIWAEIIKDGPGAATITREETGEAPAAPGGDSKEAAGPGAARKTDNEVSRASHHSAPHARSVVANRLISRAKRLRAAGALCTEDAVQMALIAGEAKEILGGMSRTTAYEAVALQNDAEVSAEVSFLGMSARIDVAQRLVKLDQEGRVVEHTLRSAALAGGQSENLEARRESEEAHLNFMLQAVKNLRMRFSEHEQIEAAEACLCAFSRHQYELMRWKFSTLPLLKWKLNPIPFVRKAAEWYLIKATKSGTSVLRLLDYSCRWIVFFGFVYFALLWSHIGFMKPGGDTLDDVDTGPVAAAFAGETSGGAPPDGAASLAGPSETSSLWELTFEQRLAGLKRPWNCLALGMWHSLFTFLELQPGLPDIEQLRMEQSHDMKWMLGYRTAVLLELIVAYSHLGLLVSVLYRRMTRRSP